MQSTPLCSHCQCRMPMWAAPCLWWQTSSLDVCFLHSSKGCYRQCLCQYWYISETSNPCTILTQVWVREYSVTPHLTAACPACVLPSSAFVADFLDLLVCRPQAPWITLTWTPGCCGSVSIGVSIWTPWLNSGREDSCHYLSSQQIPKLLQYLMAIVLECFARRYTNSTQKTYICLKRT